MRRSAEDAARTRLALLRAALLAFEEKGWRGATFQIIAERAGLTRGALHHHFHDKTTLLREALSWGWTEYGDRLFVAAADGEDAESRLIALLVTYVRLLTADPLFRALAFSTVLVAPQAFDSATEKDAGLDDWHARTAQLVSSDAAATRLLTATEIAGLVLVLLQGFTVTAVTRPYDLPQSQSLGATATALVQGLLS